MAFTINKYHRRKILMILFILCGLSSATGLALYALKQNINVYLTPSQLSSASLTNPQFKLGGFVKKGSLKKNKDGSITFVVTDFKREIPVYFRGILPDLFREEKGMIAEGKLVDHLFVANFILAKHDENYMPNKMENK